MISFVPLTSADAPLLASIGRTSLLELHGNSAPIEIMQAYVNQCFTMEVCHAELADTANIFSAVYYNDQPAGYSKII